MLALLRAWHWLTGRCAQHQPDERGVCRVCGQSDDPVQDFANIT